MYFDGPVARIGSSAGVYIISPSVSSESMSYKLKFECTNNVAEYKVLLLGMQALKDRGAKKIQIIGDS